MEGAENLKLFQELWNIFLKMDFVAGSFVLRAETSKLNWKEYLMKLNIILSPILTITLFFGTFYCGKLGNLLASIIVLALFEIIFTIYYAMWIMVSNRDEIQKLLDWCRKLYDVENTFHPKIQHLAQKKVPWMHRWSFNLTKWIRNITNFEVLIIGLGIPVLGLFLPENIYPKYSLTIPLYLPLKNQDNLMVYLTTTVLESMLFMDFLTMAQLGYGVILLTLFQVYVFMSIVEESIELMKDEMEEEFNGNGILSVTPREKEDKLAIKEWTIIIVEMICDAKQIIKLYNNLFSFTFLLVEFTAYSAIHITAFLIVVMKEQQLCGFAFLTTTMMFFILCSAFVAVEDKFSDVFDQFYNLPWYDLTPRERKIIIQAMTCSEKHTGFTAAGMHVIDLDRFTTVVNNAYGNFLILKDLVMA